MVLAARGRHQLACAVVTRFDTILAVHLRLRSGQCRRVAVACRVIILIVADWPLVAFVYPNLMRHSHVWAVIQHMFGYASPQI